MKLNLKSLLPLLLTAPAPTLAADCTAPNQQVFSQAAVEMMWSIRAWLCPNAWWQYIVAYPDGAWCDAGGGIASAFYGSWTIQGMQSEQQCWDITEEIINQCMWYDFASTSYNGGSWTYGGIYAGGWFWVDNSRSCVHPVKRDGGSEEVDWERLGLNFTLADGSTGHVDAKVWLDLSGEEAVVVKEEKY
ncbi:uncharacterized protein BDV17DRAFT_28052 [Aspergillus undulatus]|uniref:uncharacterized protein n=1 Tax=Aspergillus undulatus TaxID=1810928 RepID=UPI003CCDAD73